jgi:hypothetical protein
LSSFCFFFFPPSLMERNESWGIKLCEI